MNIKQLIEELPSVHKISNARDRISALNKSTATKLIVLDDDPTGCQTVHDVNILTKWDVELLERNLKAGNCFYVLTNSRAYSEDKAAQLNRDVVGNVNKIAGYQEKIRYISRSDSTLRGHFPIEIDVIAEHCKPFDGLVIAPYFKEGGRFTVNNIHYVQQGSELIPAHKTEFANDPVFGFQNSNLPAWIEEKSNGRWKANDVICIGLNEIRLGGVDIVYKMLMESRNLQPIVVNSLCDQDMEIFVLALLKAEAAGKRFLYRTAASFVKIRAGISDEQLYQPKNKKHGGLIIVGSYVKKTGQQLKHLLDNYEITTIELKIDAILNDQNQQYLNGIGQKLENSLLNKKDVVIYTEREYKLTGTKEEKLLAGKRISNFLSAMVAALKVQPQFIISKGGITSHDIATNGLHISEALVIGQIAPGIPIWRTKKESRFPDLEYVVFPGNVGDNNTLSRVYYQFIK